MFPHTDPRLVSAHLHCRVTSSSCASGLPYKHRQMWMEQSTRYGLCCVRRKLLFQEKKENMCVDEQVTSTCFCRLLFFLLFLFPHVSLLCSSASVPLFRYFPLFLFFFLPQAHITAAVGKVDDICHRRLSFSRTLTSVSRTQTRSVGCDHGMKWLHVQREPRDWMFLV